MINIGLSNHRLNRFDEALKYYRKGLDCAIFYKNNDGIVSLLSNIGQLYFDMEKFDSMNKIFAFGKDINIQLDFFSEMTLEILDLTGKVIKTKSILDLQTTIKVEKSGIYIVRLLSKDNKVLYVQKVLCN